MTKRNPRPVQSRAGLELEGPPGSDEASTDGHTPVRRADGQHCRPGLRNGVWALSTVGRPRTQEPTPRTQARQAQAIGFYDSGIFSIHICSNTSLVENYYIQKNQVSENVPASCCFQLWMPLHDFLT